jgi:hypothetical protein
VGGDARGVSANGGSVTARSLLLALGAALALSVAHASADEIDPQELGAIDATMTEFVHAVAKTSGARASELVDESVAHTFEDCRLKALYMTYEEFVNASVVNCAYTDIMRFRLNFKVADLVGRTGREAFAAFVDKRLLMDPRFASVLPIELRDVRSRDGDLTHGVIAQVYVRGQELNGSFAGFTKQGSEWRLNIQTVNVLAYLDAIAFQWVAAEDPDEEIALRWRHERWDRGLAAMARYDTAEPHSKQDIYGPGWFATFTDVPYDPKYWEPMAPAPSRPSAGP